MVKPVLLNTDGTTSRPLTRSSLRNGEVRLANPTGITRSRRRPPTARAPAAVRATGSSDGQLAGVPVIAPPPPPSSLSGPPASSGPSAPATARRCPFCVIRQHPGPALHAPEECPMVVSPGHRRKVIQGAKQCTRCLFAPYSQAHKETCEARCNLCPHQHHPALCDAEVRRLRQAAQ